MKDLQIRGAGNLLGARQSGHISAVGFSLYCRLLAEAVEEQKSRLAGGKEAEIKRLPAPNIDLPLPAYIPEEYVADINTRLELYQNLAKLEEVEQLDDIAREYADRFGALPGEVKNLLYTIKIKLLAAKAGIETIATEEDGQIVIRLFQGMQLTEQQRELSFPDGVKVGIRQIRLNPQRLGKGWKKILEEVVRKIR
jgi:transcription-repair coupling factor (superfamily II helicase)